ncbi:hypothetical protein EDB89DRAFT_409135 [Lactarius sanguifluus]|nr:hypothetical protein EDB89DRAFT_409135 [Lactarius sanguifluus]
MPASKHFVSFSDEVAEQSPNALVPRLVIRPWRLGACQRRSTQAHCHRGVRPSSVNASRWLSGKARSSPSVPGTDPMTGHVLFAHVDARLCYALAFGVYMSSYLEDLVCSPRPYAPPVVRLTVGNHHLEYGLPSTHSTNSTSMALFLGAHVHDLHRLGSLSTTAFATWVVVFVYVFSIVVDRLYTRMHGSMDCSVGIILGVISWLLQHLVMPQVEK